MNALTAVLSFLFTSIVMLVIMGIVRYIMDTIQLHLTVFYSSVHQLFFISMSFMTIFGVIAIALNRMGVGEKLMRGRY